MNKYLRTYLFEFRTLCLLLILSSYLPAQTSHNATAPLLPSTTAANLSPLKEVLQAIEEAHSLYFLYESDLIAPYKVDLKTVDINSEPDLLLKQLLAPLPLDFQKISARSYVLIRSASTVRVYGKILDRQQNPLIGATIKIIDQASGTIADPSGNYELLLPSGRQLIEISFVGFKSIRKVLELNNEPSVHLNFELNQCATLQEVVVVGSPFRATSLLEKTEPADLLTAQKIQQSNATATGSFLQYAVPSFHSMAQTISDGTDHIAPATLRGLGPDQLLVLINGKRRHSSSLVNINGTIGRGSVATDLNAIPIAAIEKIEVLRDGAAVQYGSDAIAGVINIILKQDTKGFTSNMLTGINQAGDGLMQQVNTHYGQAIGQKGGYFNMTAEFRKKERTNRSGDYTGKIFGDERDADQLARNAFFAQTGFKNQRVMSIGSAASTDAGLFFNSSVPLNKKAEIYGFGGLSFRLGSSYGFYRFPYQTTKQSGLYPFGFAPELQANIFDQSITIGIKNMQVPWHIDISNTSGNNRFLFKVNNSNNASMGLDSPTSGNAGGFGYFQNVTNLNISRKIDWLIPINFDVGSEFRLERFNQQAGEEASWSHRGDRTENGLLKEAGFQVFPGFRPENEVDEYRYNLGVFSNIELRCSPNFLISVAGRYAYYSDFGNHLIGKVGMRYTFNQRLTLRANINNGFRAPSMPQIYFSSRAFQYVSVNDKQQSIQVEHFNNQDFVARQFGIQALKAEKSTNSSFGMAIQILQSLHLTADLYHIAIQDRIVLTGHVSKDDDVRFLQILQPVGIDKAQFFINAVKTKTQGVDLSLKQSLKFKKSTVTLSAAINLNQTRLINAENLSFPIRTSSLLKGHEEVLFNREEVSRIEVAQPRSKFIFNLMLQHHKIQANFNLTRFGTVSYIHPLDGAPENWAFNTISNQNETRDQVFSPKWVSNMHASYRINNSFTFSLGGQNIFNVYPDKHKHSANVSEGLFTYSRRVQQFGVSGAFWYSQLTFNF